ncbi:unnamed protein product [Anisakis simplex]|uniref:ANAPC4_WD40 domain-containing protein n=1 Tax=Anisakis simplex TaxID=6269 RepID=A0A0M3J1B7_ANISI|nr:unnamed protein product [Anisakis simplex]
MAEITCDGNARTVDTGRCTEALIGMFVWAITTSGDLLCRGGVSAQNPAGDFWEEVCSENIHIVDVCASSSNCLWAITAQNTVLVRTVMNATDITCADWHTVETPSAMTGHLKQIESGRVSVWLLTDDGELFLRLGITSKNVLGDYWYQFGSDNGAMICWISVDKNDRLYAIKKMNANKNSASFTVVRTRDFEFVSEIYRRRQHALPKNKGRSAGKNNEQPVKIEWETGMTNFGCPQISVW